MKNKTFIIIWNLVVDSIPIVLPLLVKHKDTIIKCAKKIKKS